MPRDVTSYKGATKRIAALGRRCSRPGDRDGCNISGQEATFQGVMGLNFGGANA